MYIHMYVYEDTPGVMQLTLRHIIGLGRRFSLSSAESIIKSPISFILGQLKACWRWRLYLISDCL